MNNTSTVAASAKIIIGAWARLWLRIASKTTWVMLLTCWTTPESSTDGGELARCQIWARTRSSTATKRSRRMMRAPADMSASSNARRITVVVAKAVPSLLISTEGANRSILRVFSEILCVVPRSCSFSSLPTHPEIRAPDYECRVWKRFAALAPWCKSVRRDTR
jgi:hypothetical protein